jgi:hypothetical protein
MLSLVMQKLIANVIQSTSVVTKEACELVYFVCRKCTLLLL